MRCCYRSSLMLAAAAALAVSSGSAAAASERVLVVGAHASLVHDAVAASSPASLTASFSPAGLAQLAMDAFGLPTGSLVRLSSDAAAQAPQQLVVKSPVQADVFAHVDAYAMVYVDSADAAVLDAVDAASTSGYHKLFDLTVDAGVSSKIPAVLARELKHSVGAHVQCAGSDVVCKPSVLDATRASTAQVESVLKAYAFLDRSVAADAALAQELAQTQQLTAAVGANTKTPNAFFAVNFAGVSTLSAAKRTAAREAIATEVTKLLAALQEVYPRSSGAQVVAAGSVSASVSSAAKPQVLDSVMAYSRMLLSFNDKVAAASLDEDDEDDDDASAVNGTVSDVTIDDIAEYQIVLWTSVILGAILLLVILAMCNMDNKRDSLLYAKFTTSNGGRKFD